MKNFTYPPSPKTFNEEVLKPSKEFRLEAFKVVLSIFLFIAVYIVLILLSVGLAAAVSWLGIMLIILKPMFLTLMIGLGMIGLGLMVIYFLFKFIFSIKRVDRSGFIEINRKDFPEIYSFIERLAKETQSPLPKKIYISQDVNASVFYDSSFLSMFFPVKKNLLIGLGFVNSVNLSEFKAVIAHEFGHFSQHSMKLGSYVFYVNRLIYNMLYDNQGYANAIDSWASISGYFQFFASLTVKIVQSIQWVLQKVYIVVNKTNLSLSRQMEHNADAVSAMVCGPEHLITALKRLEISGLCYNTLLNQYERWIELNLKPDNIYSHQSEIISHFAINNDMELEYGLPRVNDNGSSNFQQSRIVVKDQWSSHPSTVERERYLQTLGIEKTETVKESAWALFSDPEKAQKLMTEKLFSVVKFKDDAVATLNLEKFKEMYYEEYKKHTYNKEFKNFYDNRRITQFNIEELGADGKSIFTDFNQIYSTENCTIPKKIDAINSDIETLKTISGKEYNIKSFDFDGKKCSKSDVPNLLKDLESERAALQESLDKIDVEIFKFVCSKSTDADKIAITDLYKTYFRAYSESEVSLKNYTELGQTIAPIYQRNSSSKIVRVIADVKVIEKRIVQQIQEVLPEAKEQKYLDDTQMEKIDHYLSKDREYYDGSNFNNVELDVFNEAMVLFVNMMYSREFIIKKKLLQKQLDIVGGN